MPETTPAPVDPSKILRSAALACKRERKDLVTAWATNVDFLRGKPFDSESDEDRVYVNSDNVFAKRKSAQLASQCPEARLAPKDGPSKPQVEAVLGAFAKRLNQEIRTADVGSALFETAKDAINAAGIGVVMCGYEARTQSKQVLAVDPQTLAPEQLAIVQQADALQPAEAAALLQANQIPVKDVPQVVSSRFYADRFSPSDFLWPLEFERSNFDTAPWLGRSNQMRKAEAKVAFKLTNTQLEAMAAGRKDGDTLRNDSGSSDNTDDEIVAYDELFYWRAKYDPDEKYLDRIYRLVFVEGIEKAVIDEQWTGQTFLEGAGYVGACKLPIRVLTLDYVSDDAIPPSDSAIARPQVNELIRSRTQMIQQRERNAPLRWHDVNRTDPLTSANLMRGVWQGSIPVKGNGNAIIGEVARANYPAENFQFDSVLKGDLTEAWGMDENQLGRFSRGRRTAREAEVVQANFATLTGFQRGRVAAFFCGIAEVLAGLLVLHGERLPQPAPAPPAAPGAQGQPPAPPPFDLRQLSQAVDYSVLPDATVLLDANARADQLMEVLDMVGKSGFVNPEPIVREILMLKGLDPASVMMKPQQKAEEPPNISYRFSGVEDLTNPVVLGMLVEKGQAPSPEAMKVALKILEAAGIPTLHHEAIAPPQQGMLPPAAPTPDALPPADARPDWTSMPTISKRGDE